MRTMSRVFVLVCLVGSLASAAAAGGFQSLDDAASLALINGHFDRDTRMSSLRQRSLAEFQKVLPIKNGRPGHAD